MTCLLQLFQRVVVTIVWMLPYVGGTVRTTSTCYCQRSWTRWRSKSSRFYPYRVTRTFTARWLPFGYSRLRDLSSTRRTSQLLYAHTSSSLITTTTGSSTGIGSRNGSTGNPFDTTHRINLLREKLLQLDCFTDETDVLNFEHVVQQTMLDPTTTVYVVMDTTTTSNENNVTTKVNGMQKYGTSAIKTCQTFYYPKRIRIENEGIDNGASDSNNNNNNATTTTTTTSKNSNNNENENDVQWIDIAASRTARQIEFLYQRQKAQQTHWIRNHDVPDPSSATSTTEELSHNRKNNVRHPFVIVLENLRSAENVGSIYRTADATRCQEVITIGITAHAIHPKVQKAALGAESHVPTHHFPNATTALQYIQETYPNYTIVCVETTSESIPYTDLQVSPNNTNSGFVFIFGNEVTGVDVNFYKSHCSYNNKLQNSFPLKTIEIPMYGRKNSLNVAVCVSIIVYEMIRQHNLLLGQPGLQ
jgi:23S rRNA (guanosine2251-2'-O)-methyltransferase